MEFKSNTTAKYFQLSEYVREQIRSGEWSANEQLPTEEALCKQYNVSRGTVRKAMDLLEQDNLIRREQGKGAFVNSYQPLPGPVTLLEYRQLTSETLVQSVITATGAMAARLSVPVGHPVIHIEQLFYDGLQPILLEKRFVAEEICPDLAEEDIEKHSIPQIWGRRCKHAPERVRSTMETRSPVEQVRRLLRIDAEAQVYHVERLSYAKVGTVDRPIVWYQGFFRLDDPQFRTAFEALV